MGFDDRLTYLLVGGLIGAVVGYSVRLLQELLRAQEERNEMAKHQDAHHAPRDEKGFMRHRVVADLMMITVLGIVVWAAFTTQQVNNDLKQTQKDLTIAQTRIEQVVSCTTEALGGALLALNERTTYTGAQADANVDLVESQAEMLGILIHEPPYPDARRAEAVRSYVAALTRFIDISNKQGDKVDKYDYPTVEGFENCLSKKAAQEE